MDRTTRKRTRTRPQSRSRSLRVIAGVALAAMAPITASVAAPVPASAVNDTRDTIVAVLDARVGQPVPNLTLPDLTGTPRSLTELRGQRAMLHVFASW